MFGRNRKVNTETEQPVQVENVSTAKKVFNIVKTVFTWIVVVFAVGMMIFTIISTTTLNRNDRSLFGYKMFIVLSDSMSISEQDTTAEDREGVHFNAGDLIFSKELDNEGLAQLQAGDVITFQSQGGDNFGEVVTHKIREVTRTAEGKLGFVTYGINTNTNDETIVDSDFVLGKYSGKIAKLGKFLEFQKSTVGYIVCIFVPFVILIILQGIKSIRLFRAYKKEQHAEMDAEKAEIAAQKAETEKMMREMLELKAQLAGQQQAQSAPPAE
ncbi:MAG: signal peptidase I, partial [Clostridia bacterium]|nr:signal peptidase I [Clostridia bacterium]